MDSVMQGLIDSGYKGYFTFEADHVLRNSNEWPNARREWSYRNKKVTKLMDVPLALKQQSIALLYQIGKHILTTYRRFEE